MNRKNIKAVQQIQKYDGHCIGSKRGMSRRAKRSSQKIVRTFLNKDLDERISEFV